MYHIEKVETKEMFPQESAALEEQRALLVEGPWADGMQMPKHYRPELLALQFHTLHATGTTAAAAATPDTNGAGDDGWSDEQARVLNSAVSFLERPETVTQLLAELEALRAGGQMRVEQECIHEAGGGRGSETCFLRCQFILKTIVFTKTGSGQT